MPKSIIIALLLTVAIGCGDDGNDMQHESASSSSTATESTGDCYFIESSNDGWINLGEVGSAEGEQAVDEAAKLKSNIYIYNCSGEVNVTGDNVTTTEMPADD